jgi:hypothetical protein
MGFSEVLQTMPIYGQADYCTYASPHGISRHKNFLKM